ncbi:MAG: hypothetical protein ACYC9N_19145 [Thermoanaerobaculia bacterium]
MIRQLAILVVFAVSCAAPEETPVPETARPAPPNAESAPSIAWLSPFEVVEAFGRRLRQVSVLGPSGATASAIRENYAPFVSTKLLDEWLREPAKAPGRQVSSPYPDRIEIETITEGEARAEVAGDVVEATNQGDVARVPVRIALAMGNGEWRITAFEQVTEEITAGGESADEQDQQAAAVEVLREYYAAIDARDYERAYKAWGPHGPPGQTLEEFKQGFADTNRVRVETGAASRVEGAAGSRYVEVPVTIVAMGTERATISRPPLAFVAAAYSRGSVGSSRRRGLVGGAV